MRRLSFSDSASRPQPALRFHLEARKRTGGNGSDGDAQIESDLQRVLHFARERGGVRYGWKRFHLERDFGQRGSRVHLDLVFRHTTLRAKNLLNGARINVYTAHAN